MAVIKENPFSLEGLRKFVGLDRSIKPTTVERERLSLEDLIDLGAFPVADGVNFLFREHRDELTDDELTPDTLIEYFGAISLARENPGRSIMLGKPDVLWSEQGGNTLVVDVTKVDEDGSEHTMPLPLVRLSGNPDRNRPPLTKNQMRDALYYLRRIPYLRDSCVLTAEEAARYARDYGNAYQQYIAATELVTVKRNRIVSIVDNNPDERGHRGRNESLDQFTFVPSFERDDEESIREPIGSVIELSDKRKALTSELRINEHDGVTVVTIHIRELKEDVNLIEDHYRKLDVSGRRRMITDHDRAKALKYFLTAGVLTGAEVTLLESRLQKEEYRKSHPIETDPLTNVRLVRRSPFLSDGQLHDTKGREYKHRREYRVGTYALISVKNLRDLPISLVVFTGTSDVTPRYMFTVPLHDAHDSIQTRSSLSNAYFQYAGALKQPNHALQQLASDGHEKGIPQIYRDEDDNLVLAWGFDDPAISREKRHGNITKGNIFTPLITGNVDAILEVYKRTLEGMFKIFYAEDIKGRLLSVGLKNRIQLL